MVLQPPRPALLEPSRRAALATTLAALCSVRPWPALAESGEITDRIRLEFAQQLNAEEKQYFRLTLGLFGKDAPVATAQFKALCAGTLAVPCEPEPTFDAMTMERAARSTLAVWKQCVASQAEPATYDGSQIWRVIQGRRVDAGAVRGKFALRDPPPTPPTEGAALKHSEAGLLSVRRGGGTFDFGITTGPDPASDADYVVIGRVVDGLDTLAALDALPVVKAAAMMGQSDRGAEGSREKSCAYGSTEAYCSQLKPLKKVTLARAAVL